MIEKNTKTHGMDRIVREHESYGMLSFTNTTSSKGINLFGSSIKCSNYITMKINIAEDTRGMNENWFYPKKCIMEVQLSPAQFAEAISTMNTVGTPVTLTNIMGKRMEKPPENENMMDLQDELHETISKLSARIDVLNKYANILRNQKGGLKVGEKNELLNGINSVTQQLKSNIPFLGEQVARQMNKTVHQAKCEVDSFITGLANKLGMKALKDKFSMNKTNQIEYKGDNEDEHRVI